MLIKTTKRQDLEMITPFEWELRLFQVNVWSECDANGQCVTRTSEELVKCDKIVFKKTNEHEIIRQRFRSKPGIVMKRDNELYLADLPKGFRLNFFKHLLNVHKCRNCEHLSAKPDRYGGCAKVRDRTVKYMYGEEAQKRRKTQILREITWSQRIEKYAFIKEGMETFNVPTLETFVVECANFERMPDDE